MALLNNPHAAAYLELAHYKTLLSSGHAALDSHLVPSSKPSSKPLNIHSDLDWIAKPPKGGEANVPLTYEEELVAGEGLILGKGGFGVTRLSKSSATGEYYAVKVLNKAAIFGRKSVAIVQSEVDILAHTRHPFIIHLFAVHQDEYRVSLVMEYAAGGELLYRKRQRQGLPDAEAKFYAAEIADALQYTHNEVGIVYHDLKPENIMLAADGHVKLIDFGLALAADDRRYDTVRSGTTMYVAPELAKERVQGAHGTAVDWWSFGCVVFEMLSGSLPFGDSAELSKYEIYTNITERKLRFGKGFGSAARHLLTRLLDKNPATRLTWEGLRAHKWFKEVHWTFLREKRIVPPWIPKSMEPGCTPCFLAWKAEPPLPDSEPPPSDEALEYCRIKTPPGYALKIPQLTPPAGTGGGRMTGSGIQLRRTVIDSVASVGAGGGRSSEIIRRKVECPGDRYSLANVEKLKRKGSSLSDLTSMRNRESFRRGVGGDHSGGHQSRATVTTGGVDFPTAGNAK